MKGRHVFFYRWGCGYVYITQTLKGIVYFTEEYANPRCIESMSVNDFNKMCRYK